jgi:hypothetical protein
MPLEFSRPIAVQIAGDLQGERSELEVSLLKSVAEVVD